MEISGNAEEQISSIERAAWNIAARHLARGQKDPVQMIVEAINEERARYIELFRLAAGETTEIPPHLADPDFER
ncbi:hypothetical protein J2Y63_006714 [Shinella sp. BE166]|uniref:Uncharacterized protein n=1 Tax=Shinella lacus TaxID=2654216 RepID=A0ABT1R272_9HYPH|nr:hypothetical protein [Shinella lacus]MCQ4629265.1 hypothetical protein [Shinella lacus]